MAKTCLHTTSAEPTEIEELSGRVLGIIGAYGMGPALDAPDPNLDTTPVPPPPQPALEPGQGDIGDRVYHLAR